MLRATRLRSLALLQPRGHRLTVSSRSWRRSSAHRRAFHATRTRLSNGEGGTNAPESGRFAGSDSSWGLYFVALSVSAFAVANIRESTRTTRSLDPVNLFRESFDIVVDNADVSSRLGGSRFEYDAIRLSLDGFRLQHSNGREHVRIKYDIEGPNERAVVFAEVSEDQREGEFVYLVVQFAGSGEVLEIIDNRQAQ